MNKKTPTPKKILMVIAYHEFRDEEYLEPRKILEQNSCQITTCSSQPGLAQGKYNTRVAVDITLDKVNIDEYDGLLFIGGGGSREYFDSETAHSMARKIIEQQKPLGAICIAPMILANAGLLKGKNFTAFPSVVEDIKALNGSYQDHGTVVDGLIVTADGPQSATSFAQAVIKLLKP